MDIVQIVLIGIVVSILYIILKDINPSFAFFLIISAGLFLFFIIMQQVANVFLFIEALGKKAKIDGIYLTTILKIIGIAYVAELGVQLTKDAGLESIASKIELAGKISILLLAIPIIQSVIEAILAFMPES